MESHRAAKAGEHVRQRGDRVLAALDEVAAAHRVPVAAPRWLADQETVVAPLASARTLQQLADASAGDDR